MPPQKKDSTMPKTNDPDFEKASDTVKSEALNGEPGEDVFAPSGGLMAMMRKRQKEKKN